jgi:hypothetical protein
MSEKPKIFYNNDTSDTGILNDLVDMFEINQKADWDENDPQVEFEELLGYVKRQRVRETSKGL